MINLFFYDLSIQSCLTILLMSVIVFNNAAFAQLQYMKQMIIFDILEKSTETIVLPPPYYHFSF